MLKSGSMLMHTSTEDPLESASQVDLDQVWTNIKLMQDGIAFFHETTGLPWWASIAAATLSVRLLLFPLGPYQMRNSLRMTLVRPKIEKAAETFKKIRSPTAADIKEYQDSTKSAFAEHKVNPLAMLLPMVASAPVMMTFFFTLRSESFSVRYPSIQEGGLYWFQDLTAMDPYYALPVLTAVSFLAIMELGSEGVDLNSQSRLMKNVFRGMVLTIVPLCYWMPSGVFVYWICNAMISLCQGQFLKLAPVRKYFDIPDAESIERAVNPKAAAVKLLSSNPAQQSFVPDKLYSTRPLKRKN